MRKFLFGFGLALVVGFLLWFFSPGLEKKVTTQALPTPFIIRGGPNITPEVVATSAAAVLPQKTVPPPVIRTLGDETALRTTLESLKVAKFENFKSIESLKVGGVATVSQNRIGLTDFKGNPLHESQVFTMTFQSVYIATLHAGTDDTLFWSTAVITIGDWQEEVSIDPLTGGQIITRTASATANFTLPVCITAIEKVDDESFTLQTERPSDEVLYLLRKLGRDFAPEAIISQAEAAARADALREEHVSEIYSLVASDAAPGGQFYNWLKSIVFAQAFGFRDVHLEIIPDTSRQIRCEDQKP